MNARLIAVLLFATVLAATGRAGTQAADLLYVCIQDDAKIAVVDMAAKSVVRTIDVTTLGFPATAKPHYIVVEPGGAGREQVSKAVAVDWWLQAEVGEAAELRLADCQLVDAGVLGEGGDGL